MSRPPKVPPCDGILVINKPSERTSHDVVESVRRLVGFRGIGHLGTLDPLATGVLVVALGRATRLARFYTGRRKRYTCAVRFGFETDTYDADGEALGPDKAPTLNSEEIAAHAAQFLGKIQQVPPAYSAKKIHGRPAHELARKNKTVKLEPVEVEVFEFLPTSVVGSVARFTVECGAGTYIRSLAYDLGKLQGSGAHLAEITRTAVGEFTLDDARSLAELEQDAKGGRLLERVIPLEKLLTDLPRTTVLPIVEKRVRHGAKFNITIAQIQPGLANEAQNAPAQLDSGDWKPSRLRVFNQQGQLIAIAEPVVPRTYQPLVVLEAMP
ncbi:MAG TPA: tRNA pseudouridine(55) synthase TruB [Candidatus Acidoferrales bacterium]|jgi:tRNA pseudouridine55 synthase|nr:tRNA pseudouridine(55) synthase TruB [Candidatus Acidoferrales bacterium]